jgi:hypothetical protein
VVVPWQRGPSRHLSSARPGIAVTGGACGDSGCQVPSVVFTPEARVLAAGRDPALLLKQEGVPMLSADLSTRKRDGHVVVTLRGELDLADPADVAAALLPPRPPSVAVADLPAAVLSHRAGAAGKCSDTADDRYYPALPDGRHPGEWPGTRGRCAWGARSAMSAWSWRSGTRP